MFINSKKKPYMKVKLLLALFFCSLVSFAQTKFEPGSYTDLNQIKHEGFIKNLDWKSSPTQILFKKNIEDVDINIIESDNLKEFEIYGISKYKKEIVNIDISANDISEIGYIKEPIFEKKEVLLQVLLEGKASLYSLNYGVYGKYFYKSESNEIEELIHKKYRVNQIEAAKMRENGDNVSAYTTILTNKDYLKQLFTNVNCETDREKIYKVAYKETSLVKYFKEYNECINTEYTLYKPVKKSKFNVKALIAANYNAVDLSYSNRTLYSNNFEKKLSVGGGFEFEVIFPYNNNKWAAFVETSYNSYSDNAFLNDDRGTSLYSQEKLDIKFNYIQISPGLRHYLFLNDVSRISIDVIYNIKKGTRNSVVAYEVERDLEVSKDLLYNLALGVNYSYKNYTLGARTYRTSNILDLTSENRYAKYSNLSVLFKYSFL